MTVSALAMTLLWTSRLAAALAAPAATSKESAEITTGRLDVTQSYSADNSSDLHLVLTDLQATVDWRESGPAPQLELHLDGRARQSWNELRDDRYRLTRLYLQYGAPTRGWHVLLGRHSPLMVPTAQIDGALLGTRAGNTVLAAFGGFLPHPLTESPNLDFAGGGFGYDFREALTNHAGGVMVQTYRGALDRAYLSQRSYLVQGPLIFFGSAVVDFMAPRGLLADVNDLPPDSQSALDRIDLTQAQLVSRLRPSRAWDLALTLSHVHTLLPNLWWQDYLTELRQERGFDLDAAAPLGTRISTAKLVGNLRLASRFVSYLGVRYDHRHLPAAEGYETRAGLKWADGASFTDLGYAFRPHFSARSHLAYLRLGTSLKTQVGLEGGATAMRSTSYATHEERWLFDVDASGWVAFDKLGQGARLAAVYQGLVDDGHWLHLVMAQVGYRF